MQIGIVMNSFDEFQKDRGCSSPKTLLISRSYKTVGVFGHHPGLFFSSIVSLLQFIFIIAYDSGKQTAFYHHKFLVGAFE
jgi:hypothetical protein